MDLFRQDTRDPTASLPLPDSGVGLDPWCSCGLFNPFNHIIILPYGQPSDGLDIEMEAKGSWTVASY